jgi:hypothetical protein
LTNVTLLRCGEGTLVWNAALAALQEPAIRLGNDRSGEEQMGQERGPGEGDQQQERTSEARRSTAHLNVLRPVGIHRELMTAAAM